MSFGTSGKNSIRITNRITRIDGLASRKAAKQSEPANDGGAKATSLLAQGEWRSEVKPKVGHRSEKATDGEEGRGGGSRGRGKSHATRMSMST